MTDNNAGEEQPVLTERRGNVLLITLNRPAVRNAVNAAARGRGRGCAGGARRRREPVGGRPHRGGRVLQRRDGPGGVRAGRVALVRGPRLRRYRPALGARSP